MYIFLYGAVNAKKRRAVKRTARKEVGGVVDRLAVRGDCYRAGDRIAARAEEPAHDGIFDHAANLVRIETQADHGIAQTAFVFVAQALDETVVEQAVVAKDGPEAIEQAVQSDHTDVAHGLPIQPPPGLRPRLVYGSFTIAIRRRGRNA
jgi:hypothetical protein